MKTTALLLSLVAPGVVAASGAAVAAPPRPTPVAEAPASAMHLVLLAMSRRGYGNLSQWITVARRRARHAPPRRG